MPQPGTAAPAHADPLETVVAALTDGGPLTAGQLAEHLHIPYSTLTPRLRLLEDHGRAERVKDPATRQTIWQAVTTTPAPRVTPDTDAADTADTDPWSHATTNPEDANTGENDADTGTDVDEPAAESLDDSTDEDAIAISAATVAELAPAADDAAPPRRRKGSIPAAILEVTRANPDATFKVSQLKKALGDASAGAIANAAVKLVVSGELVCVRETPATYQAA